MAAITLFDQINKDKVINFCVENGKCSDCGNCCSNCLPLTQAEIKFIKSILGRIIFFRSIILQYCRQLMLLIGFVHLGMR